METATQCCNNRIAVRSTSVICFAKPWYAVVNSLSQNFRIIIDLSNQLCKAQKVPEKHNKLNCVDYDAGIVQTLLLATTKI